MCVFSMVGDHYTDIFNKNPWVITTTGGTMIGPSKEEFDALKKEVENMKQLLIKAKIYDEQNGEPDCEMEEKISKLREVAKLVGVDLEEVFKKMGEKQETK